MSTRRVNLTRFICGVQKLKPQRASSYSGSHGSFSSSSSGYSNCEELSAEESFPASDIPEGHLAVYVGAEKRRYVIETKYLNTRPFRALLDKCAQEFGFSQEGGITIPCELQLFEHLLWLLNNNDPAAELLEMEELIHFYSS
ncbi:hypothetical protein O6H91_12G079900 [Diphasiastrum complanatum]|uniref:Uncharacterized protein n=1 Tax=Diphasiastrum complanatum TaxID=34168 RepID=A0ACC2C3V0_DIPCM|nr:hypothetical protein O6H91_12G079900 [Diphasiastrum complanatum]